VNPRCKPKAAEHIERIHLSNGVAFLQVCKNHVTLALCAFLVVVDVLCHICDILIVDYYTPPFAIQLFVVVVVLENANVIVIAF
jgi:hypothetical protein